MSQRVNTMSKPAGGICTEVLLFLSVFNPDILNFSEEEKQKVSKAEAKLAKI